MSWQSHNQRDDDEEAEWRKLPLRERYDWPSLVLFAVFLGAFVWALWSR
jgi:hypothetical protein